MPKNPFIMATIAKQSMRKMIASHKREKIYKSARNINTYHHNIIEDFSDYHEKIEGADARKRRGNNMAKISSKFKNIFNPLNYKNQLLKGG